MATFISKWAQRQTEIFTMERAFMRLVNMWPGDNLINPKFLTIFLLNFLMMCAPQVLYVLRSEDDFVDIIIGICELIQSIVYNVKMISVLVSRDDLKALVQCIEKSFKACKSESQEVRDFHGQTVRRSSLIVLIYLLMVPICLLIYFYVPILVALVKKVLLRSDDVSYPMLKADFYFFDPRDNNFVFVIFTIVTRFYINFFLMEFYIMDLFLVTLFFYVGSYMEAVKLKFRLLAEEENLTEAETVKRLKSIIDDHATAVWMVKTLDKVIRNMMLAQFLLFSLSFCFVLFNMTQLAGDFFLLIIVSMYIVVTQFEQFVLCFLATKISNESQLIGRYAYDIKFYNHSASMQSLIAFVIMRAQDEKIAITAGKFYVSDLQSFGKVLQSSLGYFTLVKSVYGNV